MYTFLFILFLIMAYPAMVQGELVSQVIQVNTSIQKERPLLLNEPGASHSIGAESEG